MVVEHYRQGAGPVYDRLREGRQLGAGLTYVDSWIVDEPQVSRCFQLMEAARPEALERWIARWSDLVEFEIFPVIGSDAAAQRVGERRSPG